MGCPSSNEVVPCEELEKAFEQCWQLHHDVVKEETMQFWDDLVGNQVKIWKEEFKVLEQKGAELQAYWRTLTSGARKCVLKGYNELDCNDMPGCHWRTVEKDDLPPKFENSSEAMAKKFGICDEKI